ncbi:MAG: carbon-nitrogen hydrolase family protein [Flavobacteriales bacterium]|nr:carbon-nitrogen hydrolase family protein [Flavobacteriales bacterium]
MIICAAQTKPVKGDFEKNIESHLTLIELAAESNVDLIVFPELSISGYEPTLAKDLATTSADKRFDIFQTKSDEHDMVIAVGCSISNNGGVSIGLVIFQPQQTRTTYLKKHLFHTEKEFFTSGESVTNLNIKNVNIGLAICYEISVPEHQKIAADNGAEIYIASVVETVEGIDKAIDKMSNTASKYAMVTLLADCIGVSGKFNCGGKSSIWNEQGESVGQLTDSETGVLIYDTVSKDVLTKIDTN